jgi:hypothetical protein
LEVGVGKGASFGLDILLFREYGLKI